MSGLQRRQDVEDKQWARAVVPSPRATRQARWKLIIIIMANADRGAIHHRALFRRYRGGAARAAARYNYAARAAEEGGLTGLMRFWWALFARESGHARPHRSLSPRAFPEHTHSRTLSVTFRRIGSEQTRFNSRGRTLTRAGTGVHIHAPNNKDNADTMTGLQHSPIPVSLSDILFIHFISHFSLSFLRARALSHPVHSLWSFFSFSLYSLYFFPTFFLFSYFKLVVPLLISTLISFFIIFFLLIRIYLFF